MRRWRFLARLGALSVFTTGAGVLLCVSGVAPAAAVPGFDLGITELPGSFRAGAAAARVSAVVSTTNDDGCRKVRWSLVLRVEGLRLDQVRIDRIEQNGSFPVQISTDGNTARITDNQLDPGTLCRGRTVTAQYRVAAAADVSDGRITFTSEAFDPNQRLLARASASRGIVSDRSPGDRADRAERRAPTTAPAETETEPPTDEPLDEAPAEASAQPGGAPPDGPAPGSDATRTDATARTGGGGTGLVTIGFVVGGLMLFLGVGLLLRLRQRMLGDDGAGDGAGELAMAAAGSGGARARTVPRGTARGTLGRGGRRGAGSSRRRPSARY